MDSVKEDEPKKLFDRLFEHEQAVVI